MRKTILTVGMVIGLIVVFGSSSFAATAGNTADPTTPYGSGMTSKGKSALGAFKFGFDADCIGERELDGGGGVANAEMDGQWYMLRLGYNFADRVEPYLKLGMAHLKTSWWEGTTHLKAKSENAIAMGFGAKVLVAQLPEYYNMKFSLDGQYNYTDPGIDMATVNDPDKSVSAAEFEVSDWQVAGLVSMEFPLNFNERLGRYKRRNAEHYYIIPYAGIAYFNTSTDVKFVNQGTNYSIGKAEADSKFLVITGCNVASKENACLNVEGRFVGETAGSGGLTLKF
ncbi:MAG: hypothetical protein ABIB11_00040 [Candidatus Omnitrophota bacterium]